MATRITFNVKCVMPKIENKKLHNFFFLTLALFFNFVNPYFVVCECL
jgi:hypothetical protein